MALPPLIELWSPRSGILSVGNLRYRTKTHLGLFETPRIPPHSGLEHLAIQETRTRLAATVRPCTAKPGASRAGGNIVSGVFAAILAKHKKSFNLIRHTSHRLRRDSAQFRADAAPSRELAEVFWRTSVRAGLQATDPEAAYSKEENNGRIYADGTGRLEGRRGLFV